MVSYIELSAKNIDTLPILDDLFTTLATEMLRNRDKLEVTQSMSLGRSAKNDIITLADDWEVLEAPEGPIPRSAYSAQEASISYRSMRQGQKKCAC